MKVLDPWLDLLFPPTCELCGRRCEPNQPACEACRPLDAPLRTPGLDRRCGRCARTLPEAIANLGAAHATCAPCRRGEAPAVDATVCLGSYRDPALRELLLRFKHAPRPALARPLGRALAARLVARPAEHGTSAPGRPEGPNHPGDPDHPKSHNPEPWIVPIPLHGARRFDRGFDQAVLLAQAIVDAGFGELGLALRRPSVAPPQGSPFARERRSNVRGAFRVRRPWPKRLRGRGVWLVDDVGTTLSTASEAARKVRGSSPLFLGLALAARADPPGS